MGPTAAAAEHGLFTAPGLSCDRAEVGKVGGPVRVDEIGLEMPGLVCQFNGRTSVARMNADFFDASCPIRGKQRQTRFFINRSAEGIAIISREFGVFVFSKCP